MSCPPELSKSGVAVVPSKVWSGHYAYSTFILSTIAVPFFFLIILRHKKYCTVNGKAFSSFVSTPFHSYNKVSSG